MAIDLNGSALGFNYATTYREEDAAVSVVASSVKVGTGSMTANTDLITVIRLQLTQLRAGDQWLIGSLPPSIVVATTEIGAVLSPPVSIDVASGTLFLRSTGAVTDAHWQAALLAIRYQTSETTGGTRILNVTAKGASGIWGESVVTTEIAVQTKNDAPLAQNDTGFASEGGDVNNSVGAVNATGNVLLNDTDADLGDAKVVTTVAFGAQAGLIGSALQGAYGTLTLNANGTYTYTVNQNNTAVESLRTNQQTLNETFTYSMRDNAGATSTATLTVTIAGRNDAPIDLAVGRTFNGTPDTVLVGGPLMAADTDFSFELKVSPKDTIILNAATLSGAPGMSGQAYAVSPEHGFYGWGSTDHAGVGLSVGTNGISVYQWTLNNLAPLLTWTGAVETDTHVAVVFNNKTPTLYVDGVAEATGLQSNKIIHPSARLGGISWGYFEGVISDYIVWNDPLTAAQVAVRASATALAEDATPAVVMAAMNLAENTAAGSLVATAGARDKDAGDTLTYALTDDAQGRFVINATTGAILVAQNAQFDHETESTVHLQVRATDSAGATVNKTLSFSVADVNEAPVAQPTFGMAIEASGINNQTPGMNGLGNVIAGHVTDVDAGDTVTVVIVDSGPDDGFVGQPLAGLYGTLVLNANGSYTYVVHNDNATVQALRTSADTLTDTFFYTVQDVAGAQSNSTLTITVRGANDNPVAVADVATALEAGGVNNGTPGVNPTGNLLTNDTDVDAGDTRTVTAVTFGATTATMGSALSGLYGVLVVHPDGTYSYTLDNDNTAVQALRTTANTLTETFSYTVRDASLAMSTATLSITIQGANDNPTGQADTLHAVEAGGVNNSTLGINPSVNVLANDTDVDANDTKQVTTWSGNTSPYGTVSIGSTGHFSFAVNNSHAAVQALRTYDDTLTATYWVNVRDAAGATSGEPVTVVIHGANDAPVSVAVGNRFDGTSASVVAGTPLGASANFSFELTVSPKDSISLKTASTTGTAGTSGQKYALSPTQGEVAWASAAHAGIGLSVGVNGISVYQHSSNLLSSLLTWTGTVTENTHVAVNVIDNTPSLFINNVLVGTGLQSTKLLHPPTEVGGISHGYFSGSIHDVRVWNQPLLWQASGSPDVQPQYEKLALAIAENAAGGSVVTRLSATDLDTGDTLTYSLIEDGGGLFQVNALTGEVYLAPGATPDHETASSITLRARATDSGGLFKDISFSVRITNVNEAPTSWGGEATMNEDNQVRLAITRVADVVINGQTVPAVRIDTLPAGGQLTLDGQPVAAGQVVSASDAVRMVFKPVLFSTAAFNMNDVDAGDSISAVRITAMPDPAQGRLLLNGVELSQETVVVHAHDFSQLTFEPVPNFNGHASFTYRVIDSHGVQQGGDASTFTIHINPVNDAPTIQPTLAIEVQEGTSTRLQGLQVNDVDAGTAEISVTLKVESGLLSAASAAGVMVMGSGSTELVLRGTVSALNSMLASEPGVSYAADLYPATDLNLQLQGVLDDGQGDPVYRATFTTPAGSLGALHTAGLTIVGDGSGLLSIEGKASVLGPYLLGQNVTRTMPMTTHQLTVVVNDNGAMGLDPGLTGDDGSEQDVRTVGLTVVPLGLSLLQPEQLDASFTHPSGPGPDGLGSAAGIAGLPLDAPLVLALGDVNRITSPVGSGEAEQLAANQEWNELHENLHPSGFNERHEWKENVNWLPPSGTVAPDGTYDVVPPDLTPNLAANPFLLIPFIVYGTMEAAYLFLTYHEPKIRPTHIPDPEVRPWIQGPDETLTLNEDQPVEITDFTFYNPSEGNRASVWVRFSLMEGGGVLSANTGADARVAVANNHSDALMLIGNVDAINELIHTGGVTFTPDPHVEGVLHLDVTISRGLSGPFIGESTTIAGLVINPIPDAPEGTDATFVVDHGASFLLTPDRFGFSDVDGDDFMGVKITELPDSGQLLLNGVPVEAGQVINMQALMSYNLAYAPDAALSGAPVHPRIGFQVMDSGSTSNIGAVRHSPITA